MPVYQTRIHQGQRDAAVWIALCDKCLRDVAWASFADQETIETLARERGALVGEAWMRREGVPPYAYTACLCAACQAKGWTIMEHELTCRPGPAEGAAAAETAEVEGWTI